VGEERVTRLSALTRRQLEVLECLAEGASAKTAARVLGIKPSTACDYLKRIHRKLGVSSRGELLRLYFMSLHPSDQPLQVDADAKTRPDHLAKVG
jgi:DNA-binding CsgD family transcriptional regulator